VSLHGKIKSAASRLLTPSLKTYSSFVEAQKASGMGYEDSELVEAIVSKTIQNRHLLHETPDFNNSSLSSLTALLFCFQEFDSVNVIDLGGSTGLQYHIIRELITEKKKINWHVVESAALVDKCKALFSTEELHFSDSLKTVINALKEIHLIHCSGVIQYLPDPYETLKTIAESNSLYLNFARMCFSKKETEIIVLQQTSLSANGFGPLPSSFKDRVLLYPQTSIQKPKFFEMLHAHYKTLFSFQDDSGVHYPEWQEGLGVFMKKK
jgi:putative methyltransferase (TIGR04325 family)